MIVVQQCLKGCSDMFEVNDIVKCISNYKSMKIGSYGVVKEINCDEVEVEVASKVGNVGSLMTTMNMSDLVKVGRLF